MSRVIVYVSCAASLEVVSFRLDTAIGVLTPLARTRVPGAVEPRTSTIPLALSPNRSVLYAAVRNPPYPVTAYAIGAQGELSELGSGRMADSTVYLSVEGGGGFLLGASYHGGKFMMNALDARHVPGEPVQVLDGLTKAHCLLSEPEGRAAYAAVLGTDQILRQQFDLATGLLDPVVHPVAQAAAGAGPRHLAFAAGGRRLYCLNELDATVDTYARDPLSGTLERVQTMPLGTPEVPGGTQAAADLHLTPDERFLYASERRSNQLVGFRVTQDGTLVPIGAVAGEPAPWGFAIDPYGRWLICAGHESGQVAVYAIDARSGGLTRIGATPAGGNACWVAMVNLPG